MRDHDISRPMREEVDDSTGDRAAPSLPSEDDPSGEDASSEVASVLRWLSAN